MTQQEFARIIESGQIVSVTPELMAAVQESANRERSKAIYAAVRWMVQRTRSAFRRLTSAGESAPAGNTIDARNCAHC
jgi:hypothetical protein